MTRRLPTRSLLDAGILPVGEIARIAKREGIRPRAAYQAHKWFARRLAATARSLLVAATTPAEQNFWSAYYGDASCKGVTVLDPFMGGGVMLLEASRLGANVHGVDVEPVAAAVSDFQGRLTALPNLQPCLDRLRETVGAEMARYYRAVDRDGREETLLHAFWVQVVTCAECGHRFDAHPNFRLAWDDAQKREWIVCEGCGEIHERKAAKKGHRCGCGVTTKPSAGRLDYGTATCPCCQHEERLITVAERTGTPPEFRLFAVETLPAEPERRWSNAERRIRAATDEDQSILERASERLRKEQASDPNFLAGGEIPREGRSDNRLLQYGYRRYSDLHNARQKLHLGLLAKAIEQIDGTAGEALRIAFSDHLTTNNLLCGYAGGWRRLSPLFAIRAFRHIARPVEINPWLEKNGRGTFPNAVRSVERAARSLKEACEPTLEGKTREVVWRDPGSWDIRCRDARDLAHIPEKSVDLVLTDPPYFNYIAYSELGHFFVPWLVRFGLVDERHLAGFPSGQLAHGERGPEAAKAFGERLSEALKSVVRVCKPEARIVFTYQNLDGHGWSGLASALAAAGIRPVQAWPMFGDSGAGLHKHENSISWDCVVLCELAEGPIDLVITEAHRREGKVFAEFWVARLGEDGHRVTAGDRANFVHAGVMVAAFSNGNSVPTPLKVDNKLSRLSEDQTT